MSVSNYAMAQAGKTCVTTTKFFYVYIGSPNPEITYKAPFHRPRTPPTEKPNPKSQFKTQPQNPHPNHPKMSKNEKKLKRINAGKNIAKGSIKYTSVQVGCQSRV